MASPVGIEVDVEAFFRDVDAQRLRHAGSHLFLVPLFLIRGATLGYPSRLLGKERSGPTLAEEEAPWVEWNLRRCEARSIRRGLGQAFTV
jgi:hypothetical protein